MRIRNLLVGLALLSISHVGLAQSMTVQARAAALQSVVQLVPYNLDSSKFYGWSGSGTIISSAGFVLTNAHVVMDEFGKPVQSILAFTTDPKRPQDEPTFSYVAIVADVSLDLDLAILRIVRDSNFGPLPNDYQFPHAPVGSAAALQLGDPIFVIGFPAVSGNTVTYTGGVVSGFLGADLRGSGSDWVKTDARIAPGNSGGGAFEASGALVGVPTLILTGEQPGVNQELLRPINYAYEMIERNVPLATVQVGPRAPSEGAMTGTGRATQGGGPGQATIQSGVSVNGSLDLTDGHYFEDRLAHAFSIHLPSRGDLQLVLESEDFDSYVVVISPSGQVVLETDDSSLSGMNVEERFHADGPGTYTLVVTTALPHESGSYRLQIAWENAGGHIEASRVDVPVGPAGRVAPSYSGRWSGYILDTAGGRGAVTATLGQTGGFSVEGSWVATFDWGTTQGSLVGLVQAEGLFLELHPDDNLACPFRGLAELHGYTISGAYTAFNCSAPIAGSVSLTLRR